MYDTTVGTGIVGLLAVRRKHTNTNSMQHHCINDPTQVSPNQPIRPPQLRKDAFDWMHGHEYGPMRIAQTFKIVHMNSRSELYSWKQKVKNWKWLNRMDLVEGINVKIMNDFLQWKLTMHHTRNDLESVTISICHRKRSYYCSILLFSTQFSRITKMYITMLFSFHSITNP